MSRGVRTVQTFVCMAVLSLLFEPLHQAVSDSGPQVLALRNQRLGSLSLFAQLVRRLDGLLKAEGVEGGAQDVDFEKALLAQTSAGTFVTAPLWRGPICILSFPGCEEILGVFLTTSDLIDPRGSQTVPAGIYAVRKRPEADKLVSLELLAQDGEIVFTRTIGPGIPVGLFRDLSLSWRDDLEVCINFQSVWGTCWEAVSRAGGEAHLRTGIQGTGTVTLVPIEQGCWGIAASNGRFYETPLLSTEFRQEGLRIRFSATALTHAVSDCQIGMIVQLLAVEPLGAAQLRELAICGQPLAFGHFLAKA